MPIVKGKAQLLTQGARIYIPYSNYARQQRLNFLPLPHKQVSLREGVTAPDLCSISPSSITPFPVCVTAPTNG
ncbi:hypothetical protein BAE46_05615 [Glaciecola punicea]|nr:hypothetical protein BAE46_05615 [Glaciecola punicea]